VRGGSGGVGIGVTYVDVDASGTKLTHDRSLARESASLACLEVLARRGALPVAWLWLFCLRGGRGLDVPPPAWGAGMVMLPWLREMVVGVRWVSKREKHHVIAKAKGHELKTPKPDNCAELQRVLRIGHLES
jgi:hypothetical protein